MKSFDLNNKLDEINKHFNNYEKLVQSIFGMYGEIKLKTLDEIINTKVENAIKKYLTRYQKQNKKDDKSIFGLPITELDLEIRTMNCLRRKSDVYQNIGDLFNEDGSLKIDELSKLHAFGSYCLKDLKDALARGGYLKNDINNPAQRERML